MAAYANYYGADILSRDKDYFRYLGRKYKVFDQFEIVQGKLQLTQKEEKHYIGSKREIIKELPVTNSRFILLDKN